MHIDNSKAFKNILTTPAPGPPQARKPPRPRRPRGDPVGDFMYIHIYIYIYI